MENKLGLNDDMLEVVERNIVNNKLNLIDERFTFNESIFNSDFLLKLNKFLFNDFYSDLGYRNNFGGIITSYLARINDYASERDVDNMFKAVEELWSFQPLNYGNTRTLLAFLKILDKAYNLDLNIDVNREIDSKNIDAYVNIK